MAAKPVAWTQRMVTTPAEWQGSDLLRHLWDVWGHSDIFVAAANPFVPADVSVGAALLDGSTGRPVMSAAIPAVSQSAKSGYLGSGTPGYPDALSFDILPLNASEIETQTFLYWDQGDFGFRDVQVGTAVALSPGKTLVMAAQGVAHPGPYGRSGPGAVASTKSALQNYIVDYRGSLPGEGKIGYTLLHQQEGAGLPYWTEELGIDSDVRRSTTWSQGLSARWEGGPVSLALYGSVLTAEMTTAPFDSDTTYLDRHSLTSWLGGELIFNVAEQVTLKVTVHRKSRAISDLQLGTIRAAASQAHLLAGRSFGGLDLGGGLGVTSGRVYFEGHAIFRSRWGQWQLSSEGAAYLDLPHLNRAASGDSTVWNEQPKQLRRTIASYTFKRPKFQLNLHAAHFLTGSDENSILAGGSMQVAPWPQILRINAAVVAMQSERESQLPAWLNGSALVTLTLPLRRTRARPFVSLGVALMGHDFTWWFDPRYSDLTRLVPLPEDPNSLVLWGTAEMGIKVRQFELRAGRINFTGQTVQNSPDIYIDPLPMTHYSLTWQFLPPTN